MAWQDGQRPWRGSEWLNTQDRLKLHPAHVLTVRSDPLEPDSGPGSEQTWRYREFEGLVGAYLAFRSGWDGCRRMKIVLSQIGVN